MDEKPIETAIKKRRNRPDLKNFGAEAIQPGDNARYLRHALFSFNLPPIDIADEKAVKSRIMEYMQYCLDNDLKPNVVGISNWLGIGHDTLSAWRRGECREATHSALIKRVYDMLEEISINYMLDGKTNPASIIFYMKNIWGWKDTTDITIAPAHGVTDENAVEVGQKYAELPPE